MSLFKNTASQKVRVFAFDATTGLPKTGDSANITAYISKDFGSVTALTDTSATEEDSTNAKGYYLFDISQSETNADDICVTGKSSTSNIVVVGAPARIATRYAGDIYARIGAPAGASIAADIAAVKTDTGNLVTRITSTLFMGITSLAQWLGLLAGKQTGNATARTEVRATGAGSGTYDETTDSQEALRDRGDVAWITATGFSTHSAADVWAVGTRALTDKAGFTLSTAGVNAVADQVWEEAVTDHSGTSGSTAAALNAAGSAGDPWATVLPGAYGAGTAGKIVGDACPRVLLALPAVAPDAAGGLVLRDIFGTITGCNVANIGAGAITANAIASNTFTSTKFASGWLVAGGVASGALNGKGDWLLSSGYTAPPSAASVAGAVRTELAAELANLDVAVGSRGSAIDLQDGVNSILGAIDDVPIAADNATAVWASGTRTLTAFAFTPSVTLSGAERNAIATALLDLADGVETNETVRQTLRAIASGVAGNVTGSGLVYKALGNSNTTRLTVVDGGSGNRTVTPSL